ncbi:hypothetical protein MF271_00130 (plasmid) [Deinococcus sp. KNUC1210]|uniref:hypothetical protein n=1 Tax=Deinococcus sp. KNUC1210 TaxID=2917691 RepID=UPI001EF0AA0D|nr:hypothetical protein [Deinococcus sp. KNUC1210]ULH13890.1 hypothetical protein MF271_00130 [Deinococcus sp. KNUC1210]
MSKPAMLLCMLTLLLGACSQNQPSLPIDSSAATSGAAPDQSDVETPASTDTSASQAALQDLAITPAPSSSVTNVRPDGTLLVGNQAFFPMGFYHVSWAGNAARRMHDMNAIADLGFNVMNATMFDPLDDLKGYQTLLASARARGMKLMVEDYNDVSIQTLKSDPAVLGWMIADDCNRLVTPDMLKSRNQHVKSLDPDHLTYASMAISFSNSHAAYFGKSDAIGNQSYPVDDGGDPVSVVYPVMKQLVTESKVNGTLPIANLQSFRWPDGRYPTTRELYSMTNQALGAGVKGILYYTYLDSTNDMNTQPQLRTELKKITGEVKLLAPLLMNGQRQEVPTTNGNVKATIWTLGNLRYLQVLNLSDTDRHSLTLSLPGSTSTLAPVFSGRPATMKLKTGSITGALDPLTAQWYALR